MEGVSLRPGGAGSLRPGGGGLLTSFASGSRPKPSVGAKEKGYDEVIKYDRDFLMAFKEVRATRSCSLCGLGAAGVWPPHQTWIVLFLQRCTDVPAELEASGSDVLLGGENEFPVPEERCVDLPGGVVLPVGVRRLTLPCPPSAPPHKARRPASGEGNTRRTRLAHPLRSGVPARGVWAGGALSPGRVLSKEFAHPREAATDPPPLQADGNTSGKRSVTRSAVSRGDGAADRTPLAPGEAGAKIVRAANPWTRVGPSDEHERLIRNVKGCVSAAPCADVAPLLTRV